MTLYGVELSLCTDAEEVASVVANELIAGARSGKSLVLTGGGTPRRAYELAAERELRAIPAQATLEPFVERVTLTVPVLASAPEVVFIVTGEDKADAVERAFGRPPGPETPSSLIRSAQGRTRVVADAAAASRLSA